MSKSAIFILRRSFIVLILIWWISTTGFAYADNNPIYKQYFTNLANEQQTGHSSIVQKYTTFHKQKAIWTHREEKQTFKQFGTSILITQKADFYENENGTPLWLEVSYSNNDEKTHYTADFSQKDKIILKYNNASPKVGDLSLAYWQQAHEWFFRMEYEEAGREFSEDIPVIFEQFEVVFNEETPLPDPQQKSDTPPQTIH